jgi:hypothetical protein
VVWDVEHELGERTVQLRQRAAHHREAAAGDLHCGGEVELVQALAEIDVIAHLEVEAARCTPAGDLDVGGLILAGRHRLVRQVGNAHDEVVDLGLQRGQPSSMRFNSSPRLATSAITALVSSPLPFSMPICFDSALRRACASWVRVWMSLRSVSSASKRAVSNANPRAARRSATCAASFRNN